MRRKTTHVIFRNGQWLLKSAGSTRTFTSKSDALEAARTEVPKNVPIVVHGRNGQILGGFIDPRDPTFARLRREVTRIIGKKRLANGKLVSALR